MLVVNRSVVCIQSVVQWWNHLSSSNSTAVLNQTFWNYGLVSKKSPQVQFDENIFWDWEVVGTYENVSVFDRTRLIYSNILLTLIAELSVIMSTVGGIISETLCTLAAVTLGIVLKPSQQVVFSPHRELSQPFPFCHFVLFFQAQGLTT